MTINQLKTMASLLRFRYLTSGRRLYSGVTRNAQPVHLDVCSLCDDAKDILRKYEGRFVLEEVYIDKPENKKAFALYRYDIPVFHMNGDYLMKHCVNEELLEKKLLEEEKKT